MNPEIGPAHQEAAAAAAWQQQQARIRELEQLLAAVNARQQMINIKPKQPDTYSGEGRSRLRAHDFVSLCETYFFAVGVDDDMQRVKFVSTLLRDSAQRWLAELSRRNAVPNTWTAFSDALVRHFMPDGSATGVRHQLHQLQQRQSVDDYADKFTSLLSQIPTMDEGERLALFYRGLKPMINTWTQFTNPATLVEAIETAKRIDTVIFRAAPRRFDSTNPYNPSFSNAVRGPTPMQLGAFNNNNHARLEPSHRRAPPPSSNNGSAPRLSKLTDAERADLKNRGACFRCRRVGHISADCPTAGNFSRQ